MNIMNIQKHEKPLLSRTEITGEIAYTGVTPSKDVLKKKLVEQLKTKEELVIVKNIITTFGEGKASFLAYLYSSKEEMQKIEPKEKEQPKEKPSDEQQPEKKEKKPVQPKEELHEEKKEEPKEENE